MSDVKKIVQEVDSSMRMEGLVLSKEDKIRIEQCLTNPDQADSILQMLIAGYKEKAAVQGHVQ